MPKLPLKKFILNKKQLLLLPLVLTAFFVGAFGAYFFSSLARESALNRAEANGQVVKVDPNKATANPLADLQLYTDPQSDIATLVQQKRAQGNTTDADLLDTIGSQPHTMWLVGPTPADPPAARDTTLIERTSTEAKAQNKTPIYKLYAIPERDACADYSKNSHITSAQYLSWLDTVLTTLKTKAIFLIEADAVAHAVQGNCMNMQQIDDRYTLLNQISTKLGGHEKVVAAYLDAGHSEWFPNSDLLVEPLKRAGVEKIRGIVVNTSFFIATEEIGPWAEGLVSKLGANKAAIIDTSRNGKGAPAANVTGENRWCNPSGRALGEAPTTKTGYDKIDAFLWVKRPGESDGSCRGNLPAGVLSEPLAKELINNS